MTDGDNDAAYRFLLAMSDASEGLVTNYDSNIKMKGSQNRQGVTCYLDSTLFSMFSRLDSFEAMLYNNFPDRPRNKLSFLLRLWVNLLRTGQLITTDVTAIIQECIKECGWKEAAELQQHDASEAFTFITGKLELPLLTLKMDIYHTGKEDTSDDHKFVNERLLDVAIPGDPSGGKKEITLEDCLEEYFNNRIEVKRYLERRSTLTSIKPSNDPKAKASSIHVETVEVYPDSAPATPTASFPGPRPPNRDRSQSIIQERYIPARGESGYSSTLTNIDTHNSTRSRAGSFRKEVMMPAWQFFSLIPWYTDNTPSNDAQVAAHFSSKRPVLGLCLKRYAVHSGRPVRLNTYIDIPVEIGLPHFIQDDHMTDNGTSFGNFKLSLRAVVCHRGTSVESGHYVALVSGTTEGSSPEDTTHWMRFDDLAPERITLIDVHQALKEESPYLLFYQIMPIDGDPGKITAGEEGTQSQVSLPLSRTSSTGRPGLDITATVDTEPGRPPMEERRPSVISFSDQTKTVSKAGSRGPSPEPTRSRGGSTDLGWIQGKTSDTGGIGKTFSMLRRRSREPEPKPQALEPKTAPQDAKPDVHVREITHSLSFETEPQHVQQPGAKPSTLEVKAPAQHQHREHRRDRSKNRTLKASKGKDKHPDRECLVM
jgi:Ubiquitin carboxyl-terminal hydrolase